MPSDRDPIYTSWTTLPAEEVISAYMNEPDGAWFAGPDGPVFLVKRVPTEEDLAWDEQEAEMDVLRATWKPDSYDY